MTEGSVIVEQLSARMDRLFERVIDELGALRKEISGTYVPRGEFDAKHDAHEQRIATIEASNKEEFERMRVWFRWLVGLAIPGTLSVVGICVGVLLHYL